MERWLLLSREVYSNVEEFNATSFVEACRQDFVRIAGSHCFEKLAYRGETMRQRKIIRTTLGELIVAVTDEVMPIVRDRSAIYMVVSYILSDLLAHQRVRINAKTRESFR